MILWAGISPQIVISVRLSTTLSVCPTRMSPQRWVVCGAGATTCTSKPALPEALSRDESDANYDDMAGEETLHAYWTYDGLTLT
jgi:hypothetical protein